MCFRVHQGPSGKIRGAVLTDEEFEAWIEQQNADMEVYDEQRQGGYQLSGNVGISGKAVVIANRPMRSAEFMAFGLVPAWSKDGKTQAGWANSRSETIHESRMFRPLIAKRRGIVPVTGFYEFKKDAQGKSHAYLVTVEGQAVFPLAAIWQEATEKGPGLPTFSIITMAPNALIGQLHDRMPVVLRPDRLDAWLDPDEQDPLAMQAILAPVPETEMAYQPMAAYVNRAGNDDPEQIIPVGEKVKL